MQTQAKKILQVKMDIDPLELKNELHLVIIRMNVTM